VSRIPKPESPQKSHPRGANPRPHELQTLIGKTVLRRSTGTKDNRVLSPTRSRHGLEFEAMLQGARDRLGCRPTFKLIQIMPPFQNLYRMTDLSLIEHDDGATWFLTSVRTEKTSVLKWASMGRKKKRGSPPFSSFRVGNCVKSLQAECKRLADLATMRASARP
jgi:hypothetical protein